MSQEQAQAKSTLSQISLKNSFFGKVLLNDFTLIAFLLAINLTCFYRTLNGYFLADDFIHIPYLARIFEGNYGLLLENFHSNWMQANGTQFYRPFISITLAFDYLIWGANAFGYHLSNVLYQSIASIFLFLFSRRLLWQYDQAQKTIAGFFAGALFAAVPLHAEVVDWVIGRVDSVCTLFYLACLWLFLKYRQDNAKTALILSIGAFVLSLLSKEMAITSPATITLLCLFDKKSNDSWWQAISHSLRIALPYWLTLVLYMIVRTLSLGTILGGYAGSIGEGLSTSFIKRFFTDGAYERIFFPFNAQLFSPGDSLHKFLFLLYVLSISSLVIRFLLLKQIPSISKYVFFAFAWLVLALLPTYQVFSLSDTLFGSRFIYLASAPFVLLLTLLVFPLSKTSPQFSGRLFRAELISSSILIGFIVCFCLITIKNNRPWIEASRQVKQFRLAIENVLDSIPANQSIVLLNLPQKTAGAHMIYNAAMLCVLLNPPLSKPNLSSRVATFEPIMFGDSGLINISRLKHVLTDSSINSFFVWDGKALVPLHFAKSNYADEQFTYEPNLVIKDPLPNQYILSPAMDIASADIDFVDVYLTATSQKPVGNNKRFVVLSWAKGEEPIPNNTDRYLILPITVDGKAHQYRFSVSQHKSWLISNPISKLKLGFITLPGENASISYQLSKIELLSGKNEIPLLQADPSEMSEAHNGVCYAKNDKCKFIYDAAGILGAKMVMVEVSKPNTWFEHYSGELRDKNLSQHILSHYKLSSLKGKFTLAANIFPNASYYEIRIAAMSKDGKVIGYVSDPINIQISSRNIAASSKKEPAIHAE